MEVIKTTGIYKIENLVNNKVYIGQSKCIEERFNQHRISLNKNQHSNKYLQRAYNKYGEENFKFEIIEECAECKLTEREQYWIDYYGSIHSSNTYNSKSPNDAIMFNEDVRKQMSKSHKENPNRYWLGKKRAKNTIEKMRNSLIEYYKNNPVSEETRKKLSIAGKGKVVSDKIRKQISETEKGWHPSIETRLKMSASAKGRKLSAETKQKISDFQKGKPKPKTEAQIQHHRESLLGRKNGPRSDAIKQKISNSKKNKPLSDSHKQALKDAWIRRKANGKGIPWNKGLSKKL